MIANDLWGLNEYYEVINSDNKSLQKAVEILTTKGAYDKMLGKKK